jgi:hypothetical protein
LRARILVDGGTPKVPPRDLAQVVVGAGFEIGEDDPDFGIVVGGDGRFSRYGRTEDIPLLFVGVRSRGPTGSRAFLARTTFSELQSSLRRIKKGAFRIEEHRRLGVLKNGEDMGEVFTDVYLQRGGDSTCIRYKVVVKGKGVSFEEAAIGDGIVVSTRAGSTGYYSYPDRIRGDWMDPKAFAKIREGEVGVCHVTPTYTERIGTGRHPLRYTVPWGTRIELALFRKADARLYGTVDSRAGVKVRIDDDIVILPGKKTTKLISLYPS